jgi:hypothetical protein
MPYVDLDELHRGRRKRIIAREVDFSRKHTAFKGCAFRALDQHVPDEQVVFVSGAG